MEVGRWVDVRAWEARLSPEDGGSMGGDRGGDGDRADALPDARVEGEMGLGSAQLCSSPLFGLVLPVQGLSEAT